MNPFVNSADFQGHHIDATSPVEPIKALVRSLESRIVQYAAEKNWENKTQLEQLEHDHQQRIQDLKTFRVRLKENELSFPLDTIEVLNQQVDILTNRLREMDFYLMQLHTDPENAARLIELQHEIFHDNSEEVRKTAIREIITRLSHHELAQWLTQQFANAEWYGWCYAPQEIEKTVNLINHFVKINREEVSYQALQSELLKHNATFLPFTRECVAFLQSKPELLNFSQTLDKIRDYFRGLTSEVMTINNNFTLIQKQTEPLIIRRFDTLQAILDDYQENIQPRAVKVHELNEQVATLQELQKGLLGCRQKLEMMGTSDKLHAKLRRMEYEEETIAELVKLRDALLNSEGKLESAVSRLITQSVELRKDLGKGFDVQIPETMELEGEGEFYDAFFDRQATSIEDSASDTHTQSPSQIRMDALLRASRHFAENLQSR